MGTPGGAPLRPSLPNSTALPLLPAHRHRGLHRGPPPCARTPCQRGCGTRCRPACCTTRPGVRARRRWAGGRARVRERRACGCPRLPSSLAGRQMEQRRLHNTTRASTPTTPTPTRPAPSPDGTVHVVGRLKLHHTHGPVAVAHHVGVRRLAHLAHKVLRGQPEAEQTREGERGTGAVHTAQHSSLPQHAPARTPTHPRPNPP